MEQKDVCGNLLNNVIDAEAVCAGCASQLENEDRGELIEAPTPRGLVSKEGDVARTVLHLANDYGPENTGINNGMDAQGNTVHAIIEETMRELAGMECIQDLKWWSA